jgi:23S rRNA (adenine-N6)-dimethyltransferase
VSERRERTTRRADLSQHFLRSKALASNLIAQAPISPSDVVVEIGPGLGIRTAAIIRRLAEATPPPDDAFLVLQREAAERFAGNPFAAESLASLLLKPWWQVEIARELSRYDFDPPPRVDSVVLWLARRARPLIDRREARAYEEFVTASFGRRGVTVGRCLRPVLSRRQIHRLERLLGFESSSAPSSLSFEQWLGLFRFQRWMRREARD